MQIRKLSPKNVIKSVNKYFNKRIKMLVLCPGRGKTPTNPHDGYKWCTRNMQKVLLLFDYINYMHSAKRSPPQFSVSGGWWPLGGSRDTQTHTLRHTQSITNERSGFPWSTCSVQMKRLTHMRLITFTILNPPPVSLLPRRRRLVSYCWW